MLIELAATKDQHVLRCTASDWLSPRLREELRRVGSMTHEVRFSKAERKVLRKRRKVSVSAWAEQHRVLTMSSMPGPWRNEVTPYLSGIMDAACERYVERVIVCKSPQVGVSEAAHNYVGWAIDRNPGPVLYVYPDEDTARENSQDRIQPMITSSRRLRSYLTGAKDDEAIMRINLQHMPVYLAWARSAARLGNKPIKHVIFDEVDKYPATTNKAEGGPIALGEKRTLTYRWNRTIWEISTPTVESGAIWQAMQHKAQVVFVFWVRCPVCGIMQRMEFDRIKFPKQERDPRRVEAGKLARYECNGCGDHWDDARRDKAVRLGEWRSQDTGETLPAYLSKDRPKAVGFHIPSWVSPFVSLSEVAAAFLKGLKDNIALRDFMNNHKAEPWVEYRTERSEDAILKLRDDRPPGLVPGGGVIAGLTAGVDTQDAGWWYEIRAWGYGEEMESWQIRAGFVPTLGALERVLWKDAYADSSGNKYLVMLCCIDAMGHRTHDVYDWCRKHRGRTYPTQGMQTMTAPHAWFNVDYYPGTKKPIPGGLRRVNVNTTFYKNLLSTRLAIAPGDPGAWHLHAETTEEWARHMCAEFVNDSEQWECPKHKPNHGWDCSVLNLVAADILGLRFMPKEKKEAKPKAVKQEAAPPGQRGRPSWFQRR